MKIKGIVIIAVILILFDNCSITFARNIGRSKKFSHNSDVTLRIHHNEIVNSEESMAFGKKGRLNHIAILSKRCGKSYSLSNNGCVRVFDQFWIDTKKLTLREKIVFK